MFFSKTTLVTCLVFFSLAQADFYLGSASVHAFTYLGRTYQVIAQADGNFRQDPQDIARLKARNTFGEIHPYVLPVTPDQISDAGVRQSQEKLLYVSPFIEMTTRYHFRVLPPRHRVQIRILETDSNGPLLAATFSGERRALSTAGLLRSFFAFPLVTLKIVAAIHWEALRLWVKGVRLVPRENVSLTPRKPTQIS